LKSKLNARRQNTVENIFLKKILQKLYRDPLFVLLEKNEVLVYNYIVLLYIDERSDKQ